MNIDQLYDNRFTVEERQRKNLLWQILCEDFFQRFVPPDSVILDIGAGFCEFINNIQGAKKYAIDPSVNISQYAKPEVKVFNTCATDLSPLANNSADVVFISNLLEHLKSKEDVVKTLSEARRVLKTGGDILILQPNIRYLYREYWDFFDHHVPLSDKSLIEALQLAGFEINKVIPRFLPYTTKSRLPQHPFLIKIYLRIPLLWNIFGGQAFVVARKT